MSACKPNHVPVRKGSLRFKMSLLATGFTLAEEQVVLDRGLARVLETLPCNSGASPALKGCPWLTMARFAAASLENITLHELSSIHSIRSGL